MTQLLIFISSLFFSEPSELFYIKVNVTGFDSNAGSANIALFNKSNGFPVYGKQIQGRVVSISNRSCTVWFKDLSKGNYAIAVYHDENNNKKMDKNVFGAPTESYGFSNNVRPTFSAPSFDDCRFYIGQNRTINITVK